MKALQNRTRQTLFGFCASHIVFTTLLDGQSIARHWYPPILQDASTWYVTTFHDPLMSAAPGELLWFQSLICCELLLQLPFFVCGCYFFGSGCWCWCDRTTTNHYPDWFRSYCIAYGAHTATTMVPILTTLVTTPDLMTTMQRSILLAFYLPYLFVPLWILYLAVTSDPGTDSNEKKKQ